jgi:hypothetical protein
MIRAFFDACMREEAAVAGALYQLALQPAGPPELLPSAAAPA